MIKLEFKKGGNLMKNKRGKRIKIKSIDDYCNQGNPYDIFRDLKLKWYQKLIIDVYKILWKLGVKR